MLILCLTGNNITTIPSDRKPESLNQSLEVNEDETIGISLKVNKNEAGRNHQRAVLLVRFYNRTGRIEMRGFLLKPGIGRLNSRTAGVLKYFFISLSFLLNIII
jgi:hypothetical protein